MFFNTIAFNSLNTIIMKYIYVIINNVFKIKFLIYNDLYIWNREKVKVDSINILDEYSMNITSIDSKDMELFIY